MLQGYGIVAMGKTDGIPGSADPDMLYELGGRLARTSAGVYTLTLEEAVPDFAGQTILSFITGADTPWYVVEDTSDTVKTIRIKVTNTATDEAFSYIVLRVPNSQPVT